MTVKQAIRYAIPRGFFSNKAGLGTTPHAHMAAMVNHLVDQGLIAMLGIVINTNIVLSITILVILSSGMLNKW